MGGDIGRLGEGRAHTPTCPRVSQVAPLSPSGNTLVALPTHTHTHLSNSLIAACLLSQRVGLKSYTPSEPRRVFGSIFRDMDLFIHQIEYLYPVQEARATQVTSQAAADLLLLRNCRVPYRKVGVQVTPASPVPDIRCPDAASVPRPWNPCSTQ
jgi:hypothetical protein